MIKTFLPNRVKRGIAALFAGAFLLAGCSMLDDAFPSEDDDPIYDKAISAVTISSEAGNELIKNASTTLTATVSHTHAKEDAISYAWEITAGGDNATIASSSTNSTVLTMKSTAVSNETVTVKVTANYDYGDKNSVSNTYNITVGDSGTVNATWDMVCSAATWTYYTDSSFTNGVTGALTNKAADAVALAYFKPTTANEDGKPHATLTGYNIIREKLGGSGTGMVGADEMTSKSINNCNWTYFKGKGSYLKLKVYGDCMISVTGGSVAADEYRGVFVFNSSGEEVASIRGSNTALTTTEAFEGHLNDEFYIVGNSGGVTEVMCYDPTYDPYDASISNDSFTVSTSAETVLAGEFATLTATMSEDAKVNSSEITYKWEITEGASYATLDTDTSTTTSTKLTVNSDAEAGKTVTAKFTATYTHNDVTSTATGTVTITTDAESEETGTVNATFDMVCSNGTWSYYTDSSFTNAVTGALSTTSGTIELGYFKPTTENSDGKPYATLKGEKLARAKLGGSGTGMVGEPNDMTSKSTANCTWSYFEAKGSYLTLKVYGDCNVTVTGGSTAANDYRGVFIFKEDGTAVDSITSATTLQSVTFTASALETFYIVGNAGGVTEIKCIDSSVDPYDASISDSDLSVSATATTVLAGNSTNVTATLSDSLNVNTSEISYQWTLTAGTDYATLTNATSATATISVNADATTDQTVTAQCVVTYAHVFNGSTSNSTATKTVNITTATTAVALSDSAEWDFTSAPTVTYNNTSSTLDSTGIAPTSSDDSVTIASAESSNSSLTFYTAVTGSTGKNTISFTNNKGVTISKWGSSAATSVIRQFGYFELVVSADSTVEITALPQGKDVFRGLWVSSVKRTSSSNDCSVSDWADDSDTAIWHVAGDGTNATQDTMSKTLTAGTYYIYANSVYISNITVTASE